MRLTGSLKKINFTDLQNGYASVTMESDGRIISVMTHIPDYPADTPLEVTYEKTVQGGIKAQSVKLYSDDAERTEQFLMSFNGVKEATAEKITAVTGADIFSYVREHKETEVAGVKRNVLSSAISQIRELLYKEELYTYLFKNGGDFTAITRLYKKFGNEALDKVKDNPYLYYLFGNGRYDISEKLAKAKGMYAFDKKRVHAVVMASMMMNRNAGNTVINFYQLMHMISYLERKAKQGYITDPLFVAEEIMKDDYSLDFHDDNVYISMSYDDFAERSVAENIKRLYNSRESIAGDPLVSVSDIEHVLGIKYSPEQEEILESIKESGVYIVTGGPGTGKTTLLKGILYKYHKENPDKKIILCSPTGAAAKRMSDATGQDSSTIHRLLGIRPYEKESLLEFSHDQIEASLIVVDETSMLDTEIAAALLASVKNGSTVLFLGDKDQLPSVGCGNVLGDLIESGYVKSFCLKTVFRQKEGSSIIDNASKIIAGDTELTEDDSFVILRKKNDKEVLKTVCDLYHKHEENGGTSDLKIFSAVKNRKFVTGTQNINRRIKDSEEDPIAFSYGPYDYSIGQKIIFVKNNNAKGYYNGQEGYITGVDRTRHGCTVYIENEDGEYALTASELCDIEPSYAITAHKAQGSECDVAVVALTKEPKNMLLRKILYVAVTRAKKKVIIVSERDALEDAISNDNDLKRNTGLIRKLDKEFGKES